VALRRYGLVAGVTLFVSCGLYAELARVPSPGSSSFRLLQYLFGTETMSSEVVVALCFFSIYKFFATLLSVTLPLPVGLFTPTFVIGGLFGRILGNFAGALFWISYDSSVMFRGRGGASSVPRLRRLRSLGICAAGRRSILDGCHQVG
jgi:H+/Cl- antiporter ClcA